MGVGQRHNNKLFVLCVWTLTLSSLAIAELFFTECSTCTECGGAANVALPVGAISVTASAFLGCDTIEHVFIPDSVSDIGEFAFHSCTLLSDVTINATNLISIGISAFQECHSLSSIDIPDTVSVIGSSAFADSGLQIFSLPVGSSLSSIPDSLFEDCLGLEHVDLSGGESLMSIGEFAFASTAVLNSIALPDSLTTIGSYAFANTGLPVIVLPDAVTEVSSYLFVDSRVEEVHLSNFTTKLGTGAFEGCDQLRFLHIPDTVTSIASYAFASSGLVNVNIPDSVVSKGLLNSLHGVFTECLDLETVVLGRNVSSLGGSNFNKCYNLVSVTFLDSDFDSFGVGEFAYAGIGTLNIPDQVTIIPEYFCYYSSLLNIYFGENSKLKSLQIGSFALSSLLSIDLPDSVTEIGDEVFQWCDELEYVGFGKSLKSIGQSAFYFTSLTSISIPNTLISMGDSAFMYAQFMKTIDIAAPGLTRIPPSAFQSTIALKSLDLTGCTGLISIGSSAFKLSRMHFLELGASLVSIEANAFESTKLTYLDLTPCTNLSFIGESAFAVGSSLVSAVMPPNLGTMGNYQFLSCYNLESLFLPDSFTETGIGMCADCFALKYLTFYPTGNLASSQPLIAADAFVRCRSLNLREASLLGNPRHTCNYLLNEAEIEPGAFEKIGQFGCCGQNMWIDVLSGYACNKCPRGKISLSKEKDLFSSSDCFDASMSFIGGTFSVIIVFVLGLVYVGFGRYETVALARRNNIIKPLVKICTGRAKLLFPLRIFRKPSKMRSQARVFLFIYVGTMIVVLVTLLLLIQFVYTVIFNSMIMYRGVSYSVPFEDAIHNFVESVSEILPTHLLFLFLPIEQVIRLFAFINVQSVQVDCVGSQAPVSLLMNVCIFGVVGLFVVSQYQMLWSLTIKTMNTSMVKKLTRTMDGKKGVEIPRRLAFAGLIFLVSTVSDPFQMILRYLMGLLSISPFLADNGRHPSTGICDTVPGYENIDTILAYSSTVLFWLLSAPTLYCIAHILIPRCHGYVEDDLSRIYAGRDKRSLYISDHLPIPDGLAEEEEEDEEGDEEGESLKQNSISERAFGSLRLESWSWKKAESLKSLSLPVVQLMLVKVCTGLSLDIYAIRCIKMWIDYTINFCCLRDTESDHDYDKQAERELIHRNRLNSLHAGGLLIDNGTIAVDNSTSPVPTAVSDDNYTTNTNSRNNVRTTNSRTSEDKYVQLEAQVPVEVQATVVSGNAEEVRIADGRQDSCVASATHSGDADVHNGHTDATTADSNNNNHNDDDGVSQTATESAFNETATTMAVNATGGTAAVTTQRRNGGVAIAEEEEEEATADITSFANDNHHLFLGAFPSYITVCRMEYHDICYYLDCLMRHSNCVLNTVFSAVAGVVKVFAAVAVFIFCFGHIFTAIGRKYLGMVLWKYFLFFQLCMGYWDKGDICLHALKLQHEFKLYCPTAGYSLEEKYMNQQIHELWSTCLGCIVATRAILLMIVPNGSLWAVLVSLVGPYPLFVRSKTLLSHIPPLIMTNVWDTAVAKEKDIFLTMYKTERRIKMSQIRITGWYRIFRVRVRCVVIVMTQGRLMNFLWGCASFATALMFTLPEMHMSIIYGLFAVNLLRFIALGLFYMLHFGTFLQLDNIDFKRTFCWTREQTRVAGSTNTTTTSSSSSSSSTSTSSSAAPPPSATAVTSATSAVTTAISTDTPGIDIATPTTSTDTGTGAGAESTVVVASHCTQNTIATATVAAFAATATETTSNEDSPITGDIELNDISDGTGTD